MGEFFLISNNRGRGVSINGGRVFFSLVVAKWDPHRIKEKIRNYVIKQYCQQNENYVYSRTPLSGTLDKWDFS